MGILFVETPLRRAFNEAYAHELKNRAQDFIAKGACIICIDLSQFDEASLSASNLLWVEKLLDELGGLPVALALKTHSEKLFERLASSSLDVWVGISSSDLSSASTWSLLAREKIGVVMEKRLIASNNASEFQAFPHGDPVEQHLSDLRFEIDVFLNHGIEPAQLMLNPFVLADAASKRVSEPALIEAERLNVRNASEFMHLGYPLAFNLECASYIQNWYHPSSKNDLVQAQAQELSLVAHAGVSVLAAQTTEPIEQALASLRPYALVVLQAQIPLLAQGYSERETLEAQLNLGVASLCQLPDSELIDLSSCIYTAHKPEATDVIEGSHQRDENIKQSACASAEQGAVLVCVLRSGVAPHELQLLLRSIPSVLGLEQPKDHRRHEGEPTALNIQLVDYQAYTCDDEELKLPRLDLLERSDVNKALSSIRPNFTPSTNECFSLPSKDE